jgi:PAS domain S-box-containing protein
VGAKIKQQHDAGEVRAKAQQGSKNSAVAKPLSPRRSWHGQQELKALQRINQALNTTLDLREVLGRIIDEVVALLRAQSASVILHDEATGEAELATTYGSNSSFQTSRYALFGSLTGWVAEHKCPLRVPRLTPEEWPSVWKLTEQLGMKPTPCAILLVPLWAQGQIVGSLEVVWAPGHGITDHEETLLEMVAVQAAIAITNARLYQEKGQALEELQTAHRRVSNILESITDAFYTLDWRWRFTYLNKQAERLLRQTQAELLGKNVWEEFPEAAVTIFHQEFHKAMAEHVKVDFEVFYPPFAAWFEIRAYPSRDGLAVYFHDITARKRAEEELQRARDAAEAANRTKSDFLATISHELRTPLAIVLGYSELLLEETFGRLEEAQAEPLRRIDRSAREVHDLITAVLDLSRLEAGRLPLESQETHVASLLQELQEETQRLHEPARLTFIWEVEPALPPLYTDAGKLKIVLKNLLGNAMKFTLMGSITVTARRLGEGVALCVSDTGIGIPAEAQAHIFEPFWQVPHPSAARGRGTGLGLHIVKRLVDLLGGTVTVESMVGHGTTFRVWMPSHPRE